MPKRLSDSEKSLRSLEHRARYGAKNSAGHHLDFHVILDHTTKLHVEWITAGKHWRYWTDRRVPGRNTEMRSREEALAVLGGPNA